ncbi:MAG: YdcF family protein [Alphaproteobacteria bacterium]|nr:YdcF family protein [Alphaproteobacteria bacterium]
MNYDAVIVLANEMDPNGILNKESTLRANLAAKLVEELKIPYVVTCGWAYRNDTRIKIADAFKAYLVNLGLKSDRIITELNSRDTVGDAVFTRVNVAEPMGFSKVCVVTSNYHVDRTTKVFDFVYGSKFSVGVKGAEVEFCDDVLAKELNSESAFNRTFSNVKVGDIDQIMEALKKNHPFYNGKIYPKI